MLDDELSADPLMVILQDSNGDTVWHSEHGHSEGTFLLETEGGRYSLCIINGLEGGDDMAANNDGMPRTVGFALRVTPLQFALRPGEDGAEDLHTSELLSASTKLMEGFRTMEDHQIYLRNREIQHRNLVEKTFQRVVMWTIIEAFVLITVATGQVTYLKKFFERRSYL
jgi:hypothetical protein